MLPSGSLYVADKEQEELRCDLDNILSRERFKWKFRSYHVRFLSSPMSGEKIQFLLALK